MSRLVIAVALLVATVAALPQNIQQKSDKITLDVYYESRCPDSKKFLVNQLAVQWDSLSSFVDLRLIPFGKASFTANSQGGWSFQCQHGPSECTGNILHACAIKYSKDTTQALKFAACLMASPSAGSSCASEAGLDFTVLDQCQSTIEGQDLVHDHGVETLGLKPKLTFVPWVIFQQEWTDANQWDSLDDIKAVACRNAPANTAACQ